jgi:hypothetical protein
MPTEQQLAEWVAEQVARFQPGALDAGIAILRRHMDAGVRDEAAHARKAHCERMSIKSKQARAARRKAAGKAA